MTQEVEAKVEINEVSSVLQELRFEIPWATVQSHLKRRLGEIKRKARPMKGFRKGKAPKWLLEQLYGPQIHAEVSQQLVTEALTKALIDNEFAPVATPEIDPGEIREGEPLEFTARVEVRPKLKAINFEGLKVTRNVHEVTNEEVDGEVRKIREEAAALVTPHPARPAKEGDVLMVDYSVFTEGTDEAEHTKEDQEVEIGRGTLLDQVEKALVGVSPGDTKEVPVELPDPGGESPRVLNFVITVKEVKEKVLPLLDDEFAKDVSEHETLLELRLALRELLEKKATSMADGMVKDQLLDALCDANDLEVPPSLIEGQLRETQAEMARMLQIDLDKQPFGDEQTELMRKQGERKVKVALLLTQVASEAEVEVTDEEIEDRLRDIADQSGQPLPKVKAQFRDEDAKDSLRLGMLQQKVVEHILSKAIIEDKPVEESTEPADGETEDDPSAESGAEKEVEDHDEE